MPCSMWHFGCIPAAFGCSRHRTAPLQGNVRPTLSPFSEAGSNVLRLSLTFLSSLFLTCPGQISRYVKSFTLEQWSLTGRQLPGSNENTEAVFMQLFWWGGESREEAPQALEHVSEATAALYSVQALPRDHVLPGEWHSQRVSARASGVLSWGSVPGGEQLLEALAERELRALALPTGGRSHLARSQITEGSLSHSLQFSICPHLILKILSVVLHP